MSRTALTAAAHGRWLARLAVCSAVAVTVVRSLNAADPGHDVTRQIEAAQNLVAGRGLTYFVRTGADLSEPATLVTLTGFPAGYSLICAALLRLGLDIRLIIKLIAALPTLIGWWGWGRLSRPFLEPALLRELFWRVTVVFLVLVTPVFYTLPWSGTDIWLWALVPWAVQLTAQASGNGARVSPRLDFLVGLVCGLAFLMRYASVFLPMCVAAIVLWQSYPRWRMVIERWLLLAAGVVPAILLQFYIDYVAANAPAVPGGLFKGVIDPPLQRLLHGVSQLSAANESWSFWMPGAIKTILFPEFGAPGAHWQNALVWLGAVSLVVAAIHYRKDTGAGESPDIRSASLLLFVFVPMALLVSMTVGRFDYVSERRYYWPLEPLSVFVAFSLASAARQRTVVAGAVQQAARLYIVGYVAMAALFAILVVTPGQLGATQREKVAGNVIRGWPTRAEVQELSPARQVFVQLARQDPGALLVTGRTAALAWDPEVDRSKVIELSCSLLEAEQLTGPARVLIMSFDEGTTDRLWFFEGTGLGRLLPADCFERLPRLRLLRRFPGERLKILEAVIQPGERIRLKP